MFFNAQSDNSNISSPLESTLSYSSSPLRFPAEIQLAFQKLQIENLLLRSQLSYFLSNRSPSNFLSMQSFSPETNINFFPADPQPRSPPKQSQTEYISSRPEVKLEHSDIKEEDSNNETRSGTEESLSGNGSEEEDNYDVIHKKVKRGEKNEIKIRRRPRDIKVEDDETEKKKKPSKAKHLWNTYGRRIEKYASEKCDPTTWEKMKNLGQLNRNKQAYIQAFRIQEEDSLETMQLRRMYAKLALEFIEREFTTTFLKSSYRKNLVANREIVKEFIENINND